jgi:hypothetical protein
MKNFFTIFIFTLLLGFSFSQAQNIIVNGDFEDGTTGWELEEYSGSGLTFEVVEGAAQIVIDSLGANPWDLQFKQIITVKPGNYDISFDVYANDSTTVGVWVQENHADWATHHSTDVNVTEGWQTVSYTTSWIPGHDTNAKVTFVLGSMTPGDTLFLDNVSVEYANLEISIDGERDGFYNDLTGPSNGYLQIRHFAWNGNGVQAADDDDLSAGFWAAWDADWFYFYEEVTDDTLGSDGTATWQNDVLEFKIDAVADVATDNSLIALGITRNQDSTGGVFVDSLGGAAFPDKEYVVTEWEGGGYTIEGKIAWDNLDSTLNANLGVGHVFGMSVANHDNDNAGAREHSIQWSAVMNDNVWSTVASHGSVEFLANGMVNFIPTNNMTGTTNYLPYDGSDIFMVDGEKDSWYEGLTGPANGYLQIRSYAWNGNGTPASDDTDLSAHFWAGWDQNNFYFYTEVTDDTLGSDGTTTYNNDVLEFKVDALGDNDAINVAIGATRNQDSTGGVFVDSLGGASTPGKEYVVVEWEDGSGYTIEGRIPWSSLWGTDTIAAATNGVYGMSVAFHDNDNAGQREHSIQWSAIMNDNVWNTPASLGTVRLLANRMLNFTARNNTVTTNQNYLPYTGADRITIDGVKDMWYSGVTTPANGYLNFNNNHYIAGNGPIPEGDEDLSTEFWASWDSDWFYFYQEVTDDSLGNNAANSYQNDVVEFKIDAVATDSTDNTLVALGITRDQQAAAPDTLGGVSPDLKDYVVIENGDGYTIEGKIAWPAMWGTDTLAAVNNRLFGMSIGVHDNDSNTRDHSILWAAIISDNVWNTTKMHGTVTLLDRGYVRFQARNNMTGVTNPLAYDGSLLPVAITLKDGVVPLKFGLEQNYPNPFNPITTINYTIPKASKVKLTIFDALGRKVADLVNENQVPGAYEVTFEASNLASGMYFYQIQAGDFIKTHKMILLK